MRVIIASRIYAPEPAAASFRLAALAERLVDAGHEVEVLTSRLARLAPEVDARVRVRRAPVLRDRSGAVRGYLPYLSFDAPLVVRLLGARRADVYVVEPPPTTGLVVAFVSALRRRPFVYYAADVLSDAAQSAGSPAPVVRAVRALERFCWRRARAVLSVSATVSARLRELGVDPARIAEVGNGVDTRVFTPDGATNDTPRACAVYAGTASEVHGAGVFVDAIALVPELDLVFVGGGVEIDMLRQRAEQGAPGRVTFLPTEAPEMVAQRLRGAAVALASVRPTGGYEFAFPTKLYAAAACGTPLVFSGAGPGVAFTEEAPLGAAVPHEVDAVAHALRAIVESPATASQRAAQAQWARGAASLRAAAERASAAVQSAVTPQSPAVG